MNAWVTDLLAALRGEHLVLSSPMPIEVARRWLSADPSGATGDVVRRAGAKINSRNAWRPVLRGHLRPTATSAASGGTETSTAAGGTETSGTETGTEFVGFLGWDPVYKAFTCGFAGTSAVIFGAGVAVTLTGSGSGSGSGSGPGPFACVFGLFGLLTCALSIVAGYRETRRQTDYLRSWITGQMNTPWYGN